MNIFSEIYGAYFLAVQKLLEKVSFSKSDIGKAFSKYAFKDSYFYIGQKILPSKGLSDWGLIKENPDGSFSPVTRNKPPKILSSLQKSFLKTMLRDKRAGLFFDNDTYLKLSERLQNEKELFDPLHFKYFDIFSDGDDYQNPVYNKHFKTILRAVKNKEILKISYVSGREKEHSGYFLPVRLQYSKKNDKFRLYSFSVSNNSPNNPTIINVGRITEIVNTGNFISDDRIDKNDLLSSLTSKEPVALEVYPERNGVERFMTEFASFEKHAEIDPDTGVCKVFLWYDPTAETEVLIEILGFGPVIKILGPEKIKMSAAERIKKQYELLSNFK